MSDNIEKYEIRLDRERIEEEMTVDDVIDMQEGKLKAAKKVLAKFIALPGGNYLSEEEGAKIVGRMSVGKLKEAMLILQGNVESAVVPLQSNET